MRERILSERCFQESLQYIAGGVNSPVRSFKQMQISPLVVYKGEGERIWDLEDNSFIDFCNSWGALLVGHAHPHVKKAVTEQMQKGSSFGIATPYELALAKKICTYIPSMEKIRFVSSGTESVMSAVRLARAFSKKNLIIKFDGNYHGHSDCLLVGAGSGVLEIEAASAGIPLSIIENTISLPYNDPDALLRFLEASGNQVAAILVEAIPVNMGVVLPEPLFLEAIRKAVKKWGILLILDEVVTGFRCSLGGVQERLGLKPDLTCLGKIIGGGLPCAAFGGREEIMQMLAPQGKVYQAGTLSGNPLAMCAGLATLEIAEQPLFYEKLEEKTEKFLQPIREALESYPVPVSLQSIGSMFTFFFGHKKVSNLVTLDKEEYRKLFLFLLENSIYFSPAPYEACFLSSAHTETDLTFVQEKLLQFFALASV